MAFLAQGARPLRISATEWGLIAKTGKAGKGTSKGRELVLLPDFVLTCRRML